MSSIGNAGRRARQFGHTHQQRYTLRYGEVDRTPLQAAEDGYASTLQPDSDSGDGYASGMPEGDIETTMPGVIHRLIDGGSATADAPPDSGGGEPDAKKVAERVYALFLADVRRERERRGNNRFPGK
ncbi:MAG: hypothetical protein GYB66_01535 [Chloroflexi bacterium]|nr:hypothetical protein [Chloroflexota bacterium]